MTVMKVGFIVNASLLANYTVSSIVIIIAIYYNQLFEEYLMFLVLICRFITVQVVLLMLASRESLNQLL